MLAGAAVAMLAPVDARARARVVATGRLAFRLPFALRTIDPHELSDPAAALLGDALFDTLYALDARGEPVASLAEADPEPGARGALRVRLRAGLRTAKGRPLEAQDAAASFARARARGARAWLTGIPVPRVEGGSLVFTGVEPARLVRALASPLVAMVPRSFSPEAPDGTGPFALRVQASEVALTRNALSARASAYLDEIVVREASDLAASVRAFETGVDDLGWHGSGIIQPRAGSVPFDHGAVGWAVLSTGRDAGSWDAPGIAQRLLDGIAPSKLGTFGLGPAWRADDESRWGGPRVTLLVRDDSPWLVELARAIAASISAEGHEVVARPVPAAEIARALKSRLYGLVLDLVRPFERTPAAQLASLASIEGGGRAEAVLAKPPRLGDVSVRTMTRTLRVGVVGELRVQGGRAADVVLPASERAGGFDLGATYRPRKEPS